LIKIAIIGKGPWANVLTETYKTIINRRNTSIPEIQLIQHSFEQDIDEIIKNKEPDIIEICSPIKTRADFAIKAIKQGINVSIAPPPAITLKEIDALIRILKKSSNKRAFRILNLLDFAFPFLKMVEFVQNKKLGKIITANIASYSTGDPDLSLLGTAYSVVDYLVSLLSKIKLVFSWSPIGVKGDFSNKTELQSIMVPVNKISHAIWTHQYGQYEHVQESPFETEFMLNLVNSHSLAFGYGVTGSMFDRSPLSRAPGIYWCHQDDHEWKSITQEGLNYKDSLISHTIDFIKSINNGKKRSLDYDKMRTCLKVVNCIILSLIKNGEPVKIDDAPRNMIRVMKDQEVAK